MKKMFAADRLRAGRCRVQYDGRCRQGHQEGWRSHREGSQVNGKIRSSGRFGGAARSRQRRYRCDHPQAVPEVDQAFRLRPECLSTNGAIWISASRGRIARKRPKNPDFVLNQPRYQGAEVLLTRDNFGCGSSREHAPWALLDFGFKAIIAESLPTFSSTTASRTASCRSCCRLPKSRRCSSRSKRRRATS